VTTGAFFDVDNTLVKGSSLFLIGRGMLQHGVLRRRDVARFAVLQLLFRVRGEHAGQLGGAQAKALALGSGLVVEDLVALSGQMFQERVAARLWPQTVELAERHLLAGHEVWLVSAAPIELVQMIADQLGLTGALGTISEVVDGRWTGRLSTPILHGAAKAVAVAELARRRGIDLAVSDAYSDSINDVHLLEAVGHPHAVNPDRALRRLALQRAWPVHQHSLDLRTAFVGSTLALKRRVRSSP
jgi:HAD superfamily hydrolase (TIGR01490 family)